ncbi:hypothetical protein BDC45DRAFT_596165, partial [Circinella umbellata]
MTDNITATTTASVTTTSVLAPKRLTCLATPFLELVQNLNNAIDKHDYTKVIDYTTVGIDQLLSKQRMILLDARAYAYSMQSQPDSAIADAHRMIGHSSMSANGYFRKANVFTMYGKQLQAIEAYDEALQNVAPGEEHDVYIRQLEQERIMVQKRNKSQIDFITKLPADIVNVEIIPFFSSSTKAVCLTVSKSWRRIIVNCSALWEQLSVDDNDQETKLFCGIVSMIGCHVKQLSINTKLTTVLTACFQFMKDGYFSKMKSLEIKEIGNVNHQGGLQSARIMIGFWKVRQTLTTLNLNVGDSTDSVKLVDILLTCTNLIRLTFATTHPLTRLIGDFSTMDQYSPLIDLEIKSEAIIGSDISMLLQRCQQLRRLVLATCNESVFDVINRYAPNLKILAYNPYFDIEQLQENDSGNVKGLRSLYTDNSLNHSISMKSILPVMYKNKTTLQTLDVNISKISAAELQNLYITHPDFTLNTIKELLFSYRTGTQQFIVRSIRNTNTLTHLGVVSIYNMDGLIEALMIMPPLSKLTLCHANFTTDRPSLTRLLERYAKAAEKSHVSLEHAYFSHCDIVSDEILSALAAINTLQKVTFRYLLSVSCSGISSMIGKLKSQLTYVSLGDMNLITDDIIIVIGNLKKLNCLELIDLQFVTDKGMYELLDKLSPMLLSNLVIRRCPNITKGYISHAKQKIKIVEHN